MAHVSPWKDTQIKEIINIMSNNPVIGVVNISGIPGPQMQKMRVNLRNKAILKISKIKLLSLAFTQMENKKQGIADLSNLLDGQVALIATDMNPFKLYRVLEQSKTKAPVKGGEVLPEDVEIKAGETSFKPGPIVGDLQRVGIPAAIEQGKVVIKSDKTVVKAGEAVPKELAQMLTRLGIYPLTVGLDLQAVFEEGTIFRKKDLAIDQQQFIDNLALGAGYAFNLAFNAGYFNPITILPLVQTAHSNAMNLMYNANIISPLTIEFMLQKGQTHMISFASNLDKDALDDELKTLLGSASAASQVTAPQAEDSSEKQDKGKDGKADKDKKEEEPTVSEEEAAAGLGALFD